MAGKGQITGKYGFCIFPIFSLFSSVFFISFPSFLLYFPYLFTIQLAFLPYFSSFHYFLLYFPNFPYHFTFQLKKSRLNCEMIWILWKKPKLNSEKKWKIRKKSKLNIEMIWKIWKKDRKDMKNTEDFSSIFFTSFHYSTCLSSVFSLSFHYFLPYFSYLFRLFFSRSFNTICNGNRSNLHF
jgi:hypothetical protein